MSGDFEELVRDSMEWFAAEVSVPSGLAGQARRGRRRQRIRAQAMIAAVTAAVTAAAVIAVTGAAGSAPPRQADGGGLRAQTAAYIIERAQRAISTRSLIMEISSPEQVVTEVPYSKPVRTSVPRSIKWAYHGRSRTEVFAAYLRRQGQPRAADTDIADGPLWPGQASPSLYRFTQTTVNYSDRTWSRGTQLTGLGAPPSGSACALVRSMNDPQVAGESIFTSPAYIQSALSCGGLSVTGRVEVDGAIAIRLTGTRRLTKMPLTMYVSPVTFFLIRVVIGGWRQDYRWLAPTAGNLAMLKVRIPAGFRRVKDASPPSSEPGP
jgi:hypothetical protein